MKRLLSLLLLVSSAGGLSAASTGSDSTIDFAHIEMGYDPSDPKSKEAVSKVLNAFARDRRASRDRIHTDLVTLIGHPDADINRMAHAALVTMVKSGGSLFSECSEFLRKLYAASEENHLFVREQFARLAYDRGDVGGWRPTKFIDSCSGELRGLGTNYPDGYPQLEE